MTNILATRYWLCWLLGVVLIGADGICGADATGTDPASLAPPGGDTAAQAPLPGAASPWPMLLGAQYTFILQNQSALRSPYAGPLSLDPNGDTQPTHTIGIYLGWAPISWGQLYLDVEKFMGAGVSNATGLGGVTNGDVVREGASGLRKQFYIARSYARFMLPLGDSLTAVDRGQDQIPGPEAATRLELKIGRMALPDDFDQNRYANSPRTAFMNWSLWADTAWDYAANTRGYTDGFVIGYISPDWSLKYGAYLMPVRANNQTLESSFSRAHGQNLELTLSPWRSGTIVRLLAWLNTARMGDYREALAIAAAAGTLPNIAADDREGRHKHGFGLNAEQPLSDNGDTGLFLRWGWNDGKTETFAFTEVDAVESFGAQLAGSHWGHSDDRLAMALVSESLSGPHRDYLAAGGSGFLLDDGRLNYGHEQLLEAYYRIQYTWPQQPGPVRWQLSPDFQYVLNPGYNRDRGPVRFWALRLHLEY
ncbi:MAG: carbohydrate porin [Steroidobacterales bacterium]